MKLVSFLNNGQESFGVLGNSGLHPVLEAFKKEVPRSQVGFWITKNQGFENVLPRKTHTFITG